MNKKIIFFDIDRTLYNPNTKSIPKSTIKALKKLHNTPNIEIAIATGRAYYMLHIIEEIKPFIDIYILINGQIIMKDGDTIFTNPLTKEEVRKVVTLFEQNNLKYGFLGEHNETLNIVDEKGKRAFELVSMNIPKVDPDFYKHHDIYQMWAFCERKNHCQYITNLNSLNVVPWLGDGFDVLSKGMSKKEGIKKILDILNISKEYAYAIGDGENDIEMLDYIPNSIAMGNGSENAKKHARFITDDIEDDGVYNALIHYKLI
ncbi:MAG: Cof-type HAD-IIB family hydrolase [Candidatus Izimaplasma sp.]|nr:Cof-type HAD-IIB family hydrolase [Candidatus Izimaplasma bacterium]